MSPRLSGLGAPEIDGYEPSSGDLYFFAVQRNPVHAASLLALFPLSQPPAACLGVAFSIDGVRWARVAKLRDCAAAPEGRSTDHPVAGGAIARGGAVHLYIQHAVPGIAASDGTPLNKYERSARTTERAARRRGASVAGLRRYSVESRRFLELTLERLSSLTH